MGSKFYYTRHQWCILCALCSAMVGCALRKSFQGPLFPREANSKGSTASVNGLVFGIYELVAFFICPLYGKYIGKIGARKMLNYGILLTAISSICFGLLDLIESQLMFITLAFLLRILESFGASAVFTSTYAIVAVVCQESVSTAVAGLKTSLSVGFVIGPMFAGYLFQLGGFMTAFITMGCLLLLQTTLTSSFFPEIDYCKKQTGDQVEIMSVLKVVPVSLALFSMAAASVSLGFFTTLEPHLRQFNINAISVGAVFTVFAVASMVASPLVGYLCDTIVNAKTLIIIGSLLIIVGASLMGPAPYIPLNTSLWLVCVGLLVHGVGFVFIIVASFSDAIHSAVASGLPNAMGLSGVVSGLTQSAFAIGDAIGPSVAGYLYDELGFRHAILFVVAVHAVLVLTMTCYVSLPHRPAQKDNDPTVEEIITRWQHGAETNALSGLDVAESASGSETVPLDIGKKRYFS